MNRDCDDRGGCEELAQERLRYFTGRHMTARDFRDEQAYHRTHRLLHNRMLHGWGVVCGLDVHPHPNPECRSRFVKIACGFALDCCGRELVVPKAVFSPEIPWDKREGGKRYLLLCLQYEETAGEPLPVLYNERDCDPQRREHSRISEGSTFAWHWLSKADLAKYYWKSGDGACPDPKDGAPCIDDDCDDAHDKARCCLDSQCPADHCVPLAVIEIERQGPVEKEHIRIDGRPALEPPQYALTHICNINWPHGGELTRGELAELGQLRVRFDRRLQKSGGNAPFGPSGVNAGTFVVQFGGGYEDLDFVPAECPPALEHDCVAVFTIDPRRRKGHGDDYDYAYLERHTVFITLHCDFLVDCHGVAVDGNHIGGKLPTGDGVAGGTFLSWFRVVPDRGKPYDQQREEVRS